MKNIVLVALAMALAPACVYAVDGVVLINQSTVSAAGGFPFKISQSGSYRLSGNLTVPDVNTNAIEITADNVSIDLNGYSIIGPAVCSGCPASCTQTGTGVGIKAGDPLFNSSAGPVQNGKRGISISNGTIRGMGNIGLIVGSSARVENVKVLSNGGVGMATHTGSTVKGNTASGNGDSGLLAGAVNMVWGNTAVGNHNFGISILGPSIVSTNAAGANGGANFSITSGTNVVDFAQGSLAGEDCGLP